MNCGQCINFSASGYKDWGNCIAPLPAWAEGMFGSGASMVFVTDNHQENYANECYLFKLKNGLEEPT